MNDTPENTAAGLWSVFDLNQGGPNQPPRYHEVSGQTWPLFRHQGCPMPQHIAVIFLRDPSFRVVDDQGNVQASLPDAENLDAARSRPKLKPGETIAKFEELTAAALLARAMLRPGADVLGPRPKRETVIEFLMTAPETASLRETEKPRGTGGYEESADDMTADEADKLLGPKPADVTKSLMGS